MSWKKYFKPVNSVLPSQSRGSSGYTTTSKYSSWLPEVYMGPPDRLQRYQVYETMDYDHEINAAMDTIADFCTDTDENSNMPFIIEYRDEPTPAEINLIEKSMKQWCILNDFNKRLWRIFRSTLMYGDQFFIRDPETFKLFWVDPNKLMKMVVNESEGKKIEAYFIRDMDLNLKDLIATNQSGDGQNHYGSTSLVFSPPLNGNIGNTSSYYGTPGAGASQFESSDEIPVDGNHVVQLSLSEGMDSGWPFGSSILEKIYKIYKQKELLEDSVLIYRVHRAPERRVFFIDVGTMPPNKAQQYLERIRYEVQQKRIPSRSGGGANVMDSTYSPMCLDLGTLIPLLDGRVLSLGEIISEFKDGKTNYVYSVDRFKFRLASAKVEWAGVTRKNAELLRVHLSNGRSVDCTPDHKFVLSDGVELEAKDLEAGNLLMSVPFKKGETPVFRDVSRNTYKVALVETLPDKRDTGDITVGNESHWFGLDAGIFVHNSMLEDYYFATTCLDLGTKIPILDGRELTLNELINEYEEGKVNYTYSQNPDMQLEPGKIVWAGVTRKDTQVVRVHLDNGECIDATPDHRFIMRDGTEVEAQDLKEYDSLMPLNSDEMSFTNVSGTVIKVSVVSVEWLLDTIDTGDITVETPSGSHIFATSAGVYVHNSEGRGSKVETLPGGENLGDIDDLRYFNNKMLRALGVPSSYLPTGPEDGSNPYSDGRVGTAFIQEFRFAKVCERYQRQVIKPLDQEFKLFLKYRGITIDNALFEVKFTAPQSFSEYRQLELDAAQINVFGAIAEVPYISKRFALKRYLGWNEEEMNENERLWKEEKGVKKGKAVQGEEDQGLAGAGITASGIEGMAPEGGFEEAGDEEFGDEEFGDEGPDIGQDEIESFGEE